MKEATACLEEEKFSVGFYIKVPAEVPLQCCKLERGKKVFLVCYRSRNCHSSVSTVQVEQCKCVLQCIPNRTTVYVHTHVHSTVQDKLVEMVGVFCTFSSLVCPSRDPVQRDATCTFPLLFSTPFCVCVRACVSVCTLGAQHAQRRQRRRIIEEDKLNGFVKAVVLLCRMSGLQHMMMPRYHSPDVHCTHGTMGTLSSIRTWTTWSTMRGHTAHVPRWLRSPEHRCQH